MNKQKKKKIEGLEGWVSTMFKLSIGGIALAAAQDSLYESLLAEEKQKQDELKLMNVIEIEFQDKNKKEIEYRELSSIDKFKKKFLKENPKWICEKELYGKIESGRLIFKRVYRKYNQKRYERYEDRCECCGALLD